MNNDTKYFLYNSPYYHIRPNFILLYSCHSNTVTYHHYPLYRPLEFEQNP
jgi:hypothetical protein